MTERRAEGPFPKQRLDSWKSIARHFGRSCRTVQRWHAEFGLPIVRLGGTKGSIFAYTDELDAWMRNRSRVVTDEHTDNSGDAFINKPLLSKDSARANLISEDSLIPGLARARSAELVAVASKMWKALSHSNLRVIARFYRDAIDLDPGNAEAFAGLSFSLIAEGLWGLLRPANAYACAKAATQRALEIDCEMPKAKCAETWLKLVSERDWKGARLGFDEALKQQPRTTRALAGRAMLYIAEGCIREASELLLEATQTHALSSSASTWYCWCQYLAGKFNHALFQIEQYRDSGRHGPVVDAVEALCYIQLEDLDAYIQRVETLAVDARYLDVVQGALGYAYAVTGQSEKANEILAAMTSPEAYEKHEPYAIALILIGLNEKQEAVKRLEQSYREGSLWSLGFVTDPILKSLRNDQHFKHFMSKAGYPVAESPGSRVRQESTFSTPALRG